MQTSEQLGSVFARSWELLRANWIMIVPGVVLALIGAFLTLPFQPAVVSSDSGIVVYAPTYSLARLLLPIVSILVTLLAISYVTGMAGAAWQNGKATLADGAAAFRRDGAQLLLALVLLFVLGIVAAVCAIFTLGLSIAAYALFFIYTFPSVIVGDRPAMDALAESCRITVKNFLTTLLVVAALFAIAFVGGLLAGVFAFFPLIGQLVALILEQVAVAYVTLVIVGEYLGLRG